MNIYPFVIRGPTRKRLVKAQGRNFFNALEKVLSVYPAKFVNFKNAKAMDLINVKKKVIALSKSNKAIEHKIWLDKEGDFYISFLNTAGHTMLVEEETNDPVEIGSVRLNKFDLQSTWVNGELIKEPEQIKKPKEVKTKKPMKTESKKSVKAEKKTERKPGKLVSMTIKNILAQVVKGAKAFNEAGKPLPERYLKGMKDQTREMKASIAV